MLMCEQTFKFRLHCGDNCFKLVHFKEQKYSFAFLNSPSLERFLPQCCLKYGGYLETKVVLHYDDNCSKLGLFKNGKKYFFSFKMH
jgi:hypothetical protein